MSVEHYRNLCNRYMGKPVEIRTKGGRVHRGVITGVDNRNVYLRPLGAGRNPGGFGYGFYGGGYGLGLGFGIALGAIGTLAFLPFFFW